MTAEGKAIGDSLLLFQEIVRKAEITEEDVSAVSVSKLLHVFSAAPDARQKAKTSYGIGSLILLVFLAKAAGYGGSCSSIEAYGRVHARMLEEAGVLKKGRCPSHDTIRRFLCSFDASWLRGKIIARVASFFGEVSDRFGGKGRLREVSVDGQEFRGTGRRDGTRTPSRNLGTLGVYSQTDRTCLYSIAIGGRKENEITAFRRALPRLNLRNVVVTADALHTQRKTAEDIVRKKGFYVMNVKDNQPALRTELEDAFASRIRGLRPSEPEERGGRTFRTIGVPSSRIGEEWPGQRTYVRMTSKRAGEDLYFISNLGDERAVVEAIELRWDIENGLHRERDFYLGQDRFAVGDRNAVEVVGVFNNAVLAFYNLVQSLLGIKRRGDVPMMFADDPVRYICLAMSMISSGQLMRLMDERMKKPKDF